MRKWVAIALLLTLVAFAQSAAVSAADFPKKNIIIIVAGSPGGGFDRLARGIGRTMRKYLPKGVHLVVKNITGGGLVIGTVAMYRAKPDGYTLGHLFTDGMLGKQLISGVAEDRLRRHQVHLYRTGRSRALQSHRRQELQVSYS